jgi:hypothetical protein
VPPLRQGPPGEPSVRQRVGRGCRRRWLTVPAAYRRDGPLSLDSRLGEPSPLGRAPVAVVAGRR